MSGAANERLALPVFLHPRCFTDDEPFGLLAADAEHGLGTRGAQPATGAGGDPRAQLLPTESSLAKERRPLAAHAADGRGRACGGGRAHCGGGTDGGSRGRPSGSQRPRLQAHRREIFLSRRPIH